MERARLEAAVEAPIERGALVRMLAEPTELDLLVVPQLRAAPVLTLAESSPQSHELEQRADPHGSRCSNADAHRRDRQSHVHRPYPPDDHGGCRFAATIR